MELQKPAAWEERPSGLVVPVRLDPTGQNGPTRNQARGSGWRQTSPGRYVSARTPRDCIRQHILEQGTRIRSQGAVTGWASLRHRGGRYFDGLTVSGVSAMPPVPVVSGTACIRSDPRITISREQLAPHEREHVDGVWITTAERGLFDEIRRHRRLREAVADIEVAVAARLISFAEFADYVGRRNAWTGIGFVREAVALAGLGCRSRPEARMALTWILDAELGRPLCNVPVFDLFGNLIAIPDLFDPWAGCAGEYQGADHKEGERHRQDVAREQGMRDVGLECFEVVGGDLTDVDLVVKRMHAARGRSLFRSAAERLWTLEPPAWWASWAAARGL